MASSGNKNINAKLVLLGDVRAGKSSSVLRFVKGQFIEFQTSFDRAKKWVQELQAQDMLDARKVAAENEKHTPWYSFLGMRSICLDILILSSFDKIEKSNKLTASKLVLRI